MPSFIIVYPTTVIIAPKSIKIDPEFRSLLTAKIPATNMIIRSR